LTETSSAGVPLVEDETGNRFLIYATEDGIQARLRYHGAKFWLTISEMAEFFDRDATGISRHIDNVIAEGELPAEGNLQKLQVTNKGGRPPTLCSLDMIISVAYRVTSSKQATMLRIWSTDKVVQILTNGFYIDKERLKSSDEQDKIAEIKEILQDIRSEQANVHRELERICSQCQDYDPKDPAWRKFFRETSAAIFYAAVQHTPSEVIRGRADADRDTMGLVTWQKKNIRKSDVTIGKNYLGQLEIDDLNRFSSLLLDFILDQAKQERMVTMPEARQRITEVTEMSGRKVLREGGSVLRKDADAHAHAEYAKFDAMRKAARQLRGDRAFDDAEQNEKN